MIVLITGVSADLSPESRSFSRPARYLLHILHNHVAIHCSDWDMLLKQRVPLTDEGHSSAKSSDKQEPETLWMNLMDVTCATPKRSCRIWYYTESVKPFCINGVNLSCGSVTCVWIDVGPTSTPTLCGGGGASGKPDKHDKNHSKQELKHTQLLVNLGHLIENSHWIAKKKKDLVLSKICIGIYC